MRVGILSYPIQFRRESDLQDQMRATADGLNRLQAPLVQAEVLDPCRPRLADYDLIHVFSAAQGNLRHVEAAHALRRPVVLTPLVSTGWNRTAGTRARFGDRLLGNRTAYELHSSYAQIRLALQHADIVLAQGEGEQRAIESAFLVAPERVRLLAPGVSVQFLEAEPALFRARTGLIKPFALMAGPVSPYKNQIGAADVARALDLPLVVIGAARERDADYLRLLRRTPGVLCLEPLRHGDPVLASAFAAAAVFLAPIHGEGFPLMTLEALAAGTPVVMTSEGALDLPAGGCALQQVAWNDSAAQRRAVARVLAERPARSAVRALVRDNTWDVVAARIAQVYAEVLS